MNKSEMYDLARHPHTAELFIDELATMPEMVAHIICLIAQCRDKTLMHLLDEVDHRINDKHDIEAAA